MNSADIRNAFLTYFKQQDHTIVDSSSLLPASDPTLLFTNAGMVPFKNTFLGLESRAYTRATSAQRCLRAGGKHNDLENVGYTARHHTFFEMLGNFSFGDYFKREAIQYAWEFLTTVLKLPKEKLWVTVYQDDDEAANIWLNEIGIPQDRLSRCGEKDNFWSMGDTGPCGPCTEIFYDHGPEIPGGPPGTPEGELDRYIEIWNIVFMQFNRDAEGNLHPLPKPSVDTGMGLERIAAVLQGVHNNYDIDTFQYLIKAIQDFAPEIDPSSPSVRVIADHIRATAFLIADHILPSNEGRGYVLRRIIRRAIRHGHKLGLKSPFFHRLVKPLAKIMGSAYPQLHTEQTHIESTLQQEEEQFTRTLEQGLRLFNTEVAHLKTTIIPGNIVFKLYDTYGFPPDLTADLAREQSLTIDETGFNECMNAQRARAKSASQFETDYTNEQQFTMSSTFHGYEKSTTFSTLIAFWHENQPVTTLKDGQTGQIVLNETPFYAESGGQVGDTGFIENKEGAFEVQDTQKIGSAIVHQGKMIRGHFAINQTVTANINLAHREAIRLNHTATHLLHAALKQIVSPNVQQKGSQVAASRCRFDFAHPQALTAAQLIAVEALVNQEIRANYAVETDIMTRAAAEKSGAIALFGEKYGESVRVLRMGDFSKELCGGTHARRTGDLGLFKIISEYGIASGVRRIELLTGDHALQWINAQLNLLNESSALLKIKPAQLVEKLTQLQTTAREQEKLLQQLQHKAASASSGDLLSEVKQIPHDNQPIQWLVKRLDEHTLPALRTQLDQLRSRLEHSVIVLYSIQNNTISAIASVSPSLAGHVQPAPTYIRHLCDKGGGKIDMAQGGGPLPADFEARLTTLEKMIFSN